MREKEQPTNVSLALSSSSVPAMVQKNGGNGAKVKPYGNVKILNSAGEAGQKKRQQMITDWRRSRSAEYIPHNSKSKECKSKESPMSSTREKLHKMKLNILRAYTDDIGDDIHSHSQSGDEEYDNFETEGRTPVGKTPEMSEAGITQYSTFLRLTQETRLTGISALAFACISAVSVDRAMEVPKMMQENGGWYFFIQFFFCLIFVAAPMASIEMALGQLTTQNASGIFATMAPVFSGMGVFMDIVRFLGSIRSRYNVSYPTIVAVLFWVMVQVEPDNVCDSSGAYCYEYNVCPNYMAHGLDRGIEMKEVFFVGDCLTPEDTDNYGMIAHRMLTTDFPSSVMERIFSLDAIVLIASLYFMGFMAFLSANGVLSYYKGSIAIMVIVGLSCTSLVIALQLGCKDNCFANDFSSSAMHLLDLPSWPNAMISACSVIGVGDGTMHSIGMHLGFENDFFKTVFFITGYGVLGVFTAFALVFAVNDGVFTEPAIRSLYTWDQNHVTVAFSHKSNPRMSELGAMLFFAIGMILLQMAYHVLTYEILYRRLMQLYPSITDVKFSLRYSILVYACIMVVGFGITNALSLGDSLDSWIQLLLNVTICAELWILLAFYGLQRFFVNIQSMLPKHQISKYLHSMLPIVKVHLWVIVVPGVTMSAFSSFTNSVNDIISMNSIVFGAIVYVIFAPSIYEITRHVLFKAKLFHFIQTSGRFGPSNMVHRKKMKYDERAARMYT